MKQKATRRGWMSLIQLSALCKLVFGTGATLALAAPDAEFVPGSVAWQLLPSQREMLLKRFAGYSPRPRYQMATHPDGSTSLLIFFPGAGPAPALLRVARDGKLLWSNLHPLTRTDSYGYNVRLAVSGDQDLLAWHETQPRSIQARLFDASGQSVWTQEVVSLPWSQAIPEQEHVTHLNAISWGSHGWAVSLSTDHRTQAYRLTSQGELPWKSGLELRPSGTGWEPVSLIMDSPDSILALWGSSGWDSPKLNKFEAQRFSPSGIFLWPKPLVVGPAPALSMVRPREIELQALELGRVKAWLYRGSASDINTDLQNYQVIITADGKLEPPPSQAP